MAKVTDVSNNVINHITSIPEEYKDVYSELLKKFNSKKNFIIEYEEVDEKLSISDVKGDTQRKTFDFKTSISLKLSFLKFVIDDYLSEDTRLFYVTFNNSVIITHCSIDEINKIKLDLEENDKPTYTIQDILDEKYVVNKEDLKRFCDKELKFSKEDNVRELTYEEKIFFILMLEYCSDFLDVYDNVKL